MKKEKPMSFYEFYKFTEESIAKMEKEQEKMIEKPLKKGKIEKNPQYEVY